MATYIPNATQLTEPTSSQTVESAALEFRTLKAHAAKAATAIQSDGTVDFTENQSMGGNDISDVRQLGVAQILLGGVLLTPADFNPESAAALRAELASDTLGEGAALVNTTQGRTVQTRLDDFDVSKNWALPADTDLTDSLTRYIAAIPATGGTVHIPRTGGVISSTITVNKPVTFIGAGAASLNNTNSGTSLQKSASLNGPMFTIASMSCAMKSITLQGLAGNGGEGVNVLDGRFTLEDVGVFGMGRDGVRIGSDAGPSNCNLWNIRNLRSKNNGRHGLHISDKARPTLPDANGGTLVHADLMYNGECGLYLGNNGLNTFSGIVAQINGTYGVRSTAESQGNHFYGGDYEVNGRGGTSSTSYYDFLLESGSKGNTVFGGSSYNFPQSFKCDEPENLIIGHRDGIYSGDDEYAGLHLFNLPSSNPRVLNYHLKGTFVPTVVGSSTAGVGTYTLQTGRFTRISDRVLFTINLTWTAHTGAGNLLISGLPYASSNVAGFMPVQISAFSLAKPANTALEASVIPNSFSIAAYTYRTDDIAATLSSLALDTGATVYISGSYEVA